MKLITKGLSHHPNDPEILTQYLHTLYEGEADQEDVKRVFEGLIKEYPGHMNTKFSHAAWLRDKGDSKEAEAYYKKLVVEHPNQYSTHAGLGQLYLKLERFPEAAGQFRQVLSIRGGKRHQIAHAGLGQVLWKLGKLVQAENEIRLAIYWAQQKEQPTAPFYTLLGRLYLDWKPQSRSTDALVAFETARNEDPDYFGNYWGIGRAHFELSKFAEAADALRMALELKPDLEPPASDEIKLLLDRCQQQLQPVAQTADSASRSSRAKAAMDQVQS